MLYHINIDEYLDNADSSVPEYKNRVRIYLQKLENETNNIINKFSTDPVISNCIKGRDLRQIKGTSDLERDENGEVVKDGDKVKTVRTRGDTTEARFPNLLDSVSITIMRTALNTAREVYAKTYQEKFTEFIKSSSNPDKDEIGRAICYSMLYSKDNWTCTRITHMYRGGKTGRENRYTGRKGDYWPCTRYEYVGNLNNKNFELKEENQRNINKYRTYVKYTNDNLKNLLNNTSEKKHLIFNTFDSEIELHKTVLSVESYSDGICTIKEDNDCIYREHDCEGSTDKLVEVLYKKYILK